MERQWGMSSSRLAELREDRIRVRLEGGDIRRKD